MILRKELSLLFVLMKCLVSIIVPVYGVEKFVVECIRSIIAIDRDDVECIIVNDCTPDSSRILIEDELAEYKGPISFRIIDHDKNLGLSEARNTGIIHSKGKWLFFLDSDDNLLTDNFVSILEQLNQYNDYQVVQGSFLSDWRKCTVSYSSFALDYKKAQEYYLHGQLVPYAWGRFIQRDFVVEHKLFFAKGILGREDIIWLLDILQIPVTVYFYGLPIVFYRENADSILHSQTYSIKRFDGITCLLEHAVSVGENMDKRSMSYLLMEHSIPNVFDQITHRITDLSSSDRFQSILNTINAQYYRHMTLSQKVVWWHIYTPLKKMLSFTWYRNRFFSFFIIIKRI